jgi:hypothetical protein
LIFFCYFFCIKAKKVEGHFEVLPSKTTTSQVVGAGRSQQEENDLRTPTTAAAATATATTTATTRAKESPEIPRHNAYKEKSPGIIPGDFSL